MKKQFLIILIFVFIILGIVGCIPPSMQTKPYKLPSLTLSPLTETAAYESYGNGVFFFDQEILQKRYPDTPRELVLASGLAHFLSEYPELEVTAICPSVNYFDRLGHSPVGYIVTCREKSK